MSSTVQQEAVKRQRRATVTAAPPAADHAAAAPAVEHQEPAQPPRVACLFQVPAGLPREPSPGAMHACRIAAWAQAGDAAGGGGAATTYGAALASGGHVFWSQLRLPASSSALQQEQQGKEGVLLPLRLPAPAAVSQLQQLPAHAGEVQALALSATSCSGHQQSHMLLATVDAYGAGSISRVQPCWEYAAASGGSGGGHDSPQEAAAPAAMAPISPPEVTVHARLQPLDICREGGWAGVCFSSTAGSSQDSSTEPALLATARGFAKDVTLYDVATAKRVRSFATMHNPYALTFLPAGVCGGGGGSGSDASLLALAEGHLVSVWDVRASGAGGGCVHRVAPSTTSQPMYTLAWCPTTVQQQGTGMLGVAGAERSLFMLEPRKWRVLTKWTGATRLAIHSLSFLDADPRCAVLAGLDLEVLTGRWDRPGSNFRPFTSTGEAGAAGHTGGGGGGLTGAGAGAAADAAASPARAAARAAAGQPGAGDNDAAALAAPAAAGGAGATSPTMFSFRGDGRWLGVSKAAGADVFAGFAASGNLVYAHVC